MRNAAHPITRRMRTNAQSDRERNPRQIIRSGAGSPGGGGRGKAQPEAETRIKILTTYVRSRNVYENKRLTDIMPEKYRTFMS